MAENTNGALDWGDSIEQDGQEFITLEEGDYNFRVAEFERGHHEATAKVPACNQANLTLEIQTDEGVATCKTVLLLHSSLEWKLSSFFRSIGQKKHGERLKMDWSKVPGAQGRAHFKPRTYTGKDGTERTANSVDKFIDYDPKYFETPDQNGFINVPEGDDDDIPF